MKKILFLFSFLFYASFSFAQNVPRQLTQFVTGKGTLTQEGAATGTLDIRIDFVDETGFFAGSNFDNTCVLLYRNTDDDKGYELPILSIVTASPTNPVVRVSITGFPLLNGAVNGQGVVYKKIAQNILRLLFRALQQDCNK